MNNNRPGLQLTSPKRLRTLGMLLIVMLCNQSMRAQLKPALADSMLNFITTNPSKSALYIDRNDTIVAQLNPDKLMPLASTVKILVAIEFAKQAGAGTINAEQYIPLQALNRYYLPLTDGGAHPRWLALEKQQQHIKQDSIRLIDVARGMIMFSSNANTEYLCDILGLNNINRNRELFGLKKHTPVYPIVSALFLYQRPAPFTEEELLEGIRKLSVKKYIADVNRIHERLKSDSTFKGTFRAGDLSLQMQQLWSDRLTASTAREYAQLAKKLNQRKILNNDAYRVLQQVLEFPMENRGFQNAFKHYGVKGGNTGFVLTHVIYLTTRNGVSMELVLFFNGLTMKEEKQLEQWLDPFEAQVIFDKSFRERLKF